MAKPSKFVSRSAWGARPRGATPITHPIGSTLGTTLHWEGPHMGSFPHSECDNKVRSIEAFHRDTRDWADIAYNALVCPHGYVFEGRGVNTMSAANGNSTDNGAWYAVCYLGGEGDPFTSDAKVGFIEAVQWLRSEGDAGSRVNGHRDHKSTECPGDVIYRWLQSANFNADPTPPPPPPVTTHTRWAIRETGVHETPGGTLVRKIPAGYSFQVVDGSGSGMDGWVQTSAGNWVVGKDTTTRDPSIPATLSVFSWNVKAGAARVDTVLAELKEMLGAEKPDVVALQECYNLPRFGDAFPGYSFSYQAAGEAKTDGYVSEYPANVMLVRDGVEVKVQAPLEMTETWKGPKVGAMHDPRIHRRVTVEKDDVTWRVVDVHVPPPISGGGNNDAIAESNAAMVECLLEFPSGEPVIIVGDMNQDNATMVRRVGAPGGAVVDGGGVDLAISRDCKKTEGENLGLHTSDHPAKKRTYEA